MGWVSIIVYLGAILLVVSSLFFKKYRWESTRQRNLNGILESLWTSAESEVRLTGVVDALEYEELSKCVHDVRVKFIHNGYRDNPQDYWCDRFIHHCGLLHLLEVKRLEDPKFNEAFKRTWALTKITLAGIVNGSSSTLNQKEKNSILNEFS